MSNFTFLTREQCSGRDRLDIFGDKKINPKGGKVINITGEQLRRLYRSFIQDKGDITR